MVKMDDNVRELFAAMRSMHAMSTPAARKIKLRADVYRLLELVHVDCKNSSGDTPLIQAAGDGDTEMVRHLLQKGAYLEAKATRQGMTALLAASRVGKVEIMKILLDAGADLHASYRYYGEPCNALHSAIHTGKDEAVEILLTNGLKTYDAESRTTPLHTAVTCFGRGASMLSFLLERGIGDVTAVDDEGRSALQECVARHYRDDDENLTATLAVLLDHGAAIDHLSTGDGQSALHYAVGLGYTQTVLFLLDRGANATIADSNGQTPLHMAACRCRDNSVAKTVTALLAKGALVNAVDGAGKTPLHYFAAYRDDKCSESVKDVTASLAVLLDHGAAIDQLSRDGESALYMAVERGTKESVLLLLGRGANAAPANRVGKTALHMAASRLRDSATAKIVTALLARGAPADAIDNEGLLCTILQRTKVTNTKTT